MCDVGGNSGDAAPLILSSQMVSLTDKTFVVRNGGGRPQPAASGRALPSRLGRYEILSELGRGAMGTVYRARDPMINREVALKSIPLSAEFEGEELEQARQKFFREAEMAGRLSHPHIVTIYDAGEHDGAAYIAMELLRGRHLVDYCCTSHGLPSSVAIEIIAKLAGALHYAHRQGVVHRDIKPANVMFDAPSGELKITDFGIARLTDAGRTRTGIVLGTPSYMSPEQLQGRPITGRSDLYSLAVTLFQLLTGQLPFRADSMLALMMKIAQ
jgi:serine/threonine-protein kinase